VIRDLDAEEIPAAAHLAAAAFREDPGFSYLLPDDAARRYRLPSLIEALLRVDAASGGRVRGAFDGDALIGISAVIPSGAPVPGLLAWLRRGRGLAWLLRSPSALLRSLALVGAMERLRPPSADYLHLLAVHPATRGRGIGAALLRDALKGGRLLYLETFTRENAAWYEARGFSLVAQAASPVRPTFWTLKRSGLTPE
jgi:ribosomal protein S18 acetylase RimI-like enzyme